MAEIMIAGIAAKVFEYAVTETQLSQELRAKLGLESTKRAFQNALFAAVRAVSYKLQEWADLIPDMTNESDTATAELGQFLVRDGRPNAIRLAQGWLAARSPRRAENRTVWLRDLESLATDFLDTFAEALKDEPELADINDSRNLESIVHHLSAIRSGMDADEATPGSRRDYLIWLRDQTLYLSEKGTAQTYRQVRVPLNDVYISLAARPHYRVKFYALHPDDSGLVHVDAGTVDPPYRQSEREYSKEVESVLGNSSETDELFEAADTVTELHDVVREHSQLVILGEPGGGKSTLSRYLALRHAEALLEAQTEAQGGLGTARFPILLRIADFAESGMSRGESLSDSLADLCSVHECPSRGLKDLLAKELTAGNCLVILDGLDEVANTDDRRKVVQSIEDFVRRHSQASNKFVITSRPASYQDTLVGLDFTHFVVQRMNSAQIERFLSQWCLAVEQAQSPDLSSDQQQHNAERQVEGILEAIEASSGVRRLATNPLLLRIVTLVHQSVGELPRKRIGLYKLAADTLARDWRLSQRVPESALAKDAYLTRILSSLAFWLHQYKSSGVASGNEILSQMGDEWAQLQGLDWDPEDPHPEIISSLGDFLRIVREQTGLLVETAPERYGFMHLTFEEYYAARHLIKRTGQRATLIRNRLHDPRWNEPVLLALGFIALDYWDDAADLLETAVLASGADAEVLGFGPSPYEDLLGRDFLFALRCLGDEIPANPATKRQLVSRLANEILNEAGLARFSRYRRMLRSRLRQLRGTDIASQLVLPRLLEGIESNDSNVQVRAIQAIEALRECPPEVVVVLANIVYRGEEKVRRHAAFALAILGDSSSDASETLLALLESDALEARFAAAGAFARALVASPEVVGPLLEAADSGFHHELAVAFLAFLQHDSDDAGAFIAKILDPNSAESHIAAIFSIQLVIRLGKSISPDVVNALFGLLREGPDRSRYHSASALRELDEANEQTAQILTDIMRSGDQEEQRSAIFAIIACNYASSEAIDTLCDIVTAGYEDNRMPASIALVHFAKQHFAVTATLQQLLLSGSEEQRLTLIVALIPSERIPPVAGMAFRMVLASHDELAGTFVSLMLIPDAESSDALESELRSLLFIDSEHVQISAALALAAFGHDSPEIRTILNETMQGSSPEFRYEATLALAKVGQSNDQTIEGLREGLRFAESDRVRVQCAHLLGQIGFPESRTLDLLVDQIRGDHATVASASSEAAISVATRTPEARDMLSEKVTRLLRDDSWWPTNTNERFDILPQDTLHDILWRISEVKFGDDPTAG